MAKARDACVFGRFSPPQMVNSQRTWQAPTVCSLKRWMPFSRRLLAAGLDASIGTTLGAVALGQMPGRISDDEITVYKAMGIAMEDMVAANLVYEAAKREGGGRVMTW